MEVLIIDVVEIIALGKYFTDKGEKKTGLFNQLQLDKDTFIGNLQKFGGRYLFLNGFISSDFFLIMHILSKVFFLSESGIFLHPP